eukprot:GHVR01138459.1.p1 GENE.GHVR01138459.1~~GHVR01138459.1.p1  ORF type:complete len:138 (+),score=5.82 GHVR01138459.1:2176-2589(+)
MIVINSPHNPTGKIFTEEEILDICKEIEKYPQIILVQDNVYEGFHFDEWKGQKLPKAIHIQEKLKYVKNRQLNIYSAGKLLEATGLRIGWIIGDSFLVNKVNSIHQYFAFCLNDMMQKTVSFCLQDIMREDYYYLAV